ncbi:MAG: aminodeoxychorismate synthase component I [Chromatiales bacterium]|nr:aminodeoxychorismate synthase component I [Chromatiales bacterium]
MLAIHVRDPERYPVLLESVATGTRQARFDLLLACPGDQLLLDEHWQLRGTHADGATDFLAALDRWAEELWLPPVPCTSPFRGGWFIYLGYELAAAVEPGLPRRSLPGQPIALALRIPAAVIRDHVRRRSWIVAEQGSEALLELLRADLAASDGPVARAGDALAHELAPPPAQDFLAAVTQARAHIAAGDIFQANLSREWWARLRPGTEPAMLYQRLRETNPAPFAGLARLPGITVISSSPERLVRFGDGLAETRPIAGTRPRKRKGRSEQALREALLASPKERAEHVMLIDLERNDLGRVCKAGSIEVDEFMVVESYAHVHHIVSNVRGRLREGTRPGSLIRAVFPGGTITGCPKVRCMEIIAALELRARGAYTGSMGYLNRDGSGDLNILIRSMVTQGQEVRIAAGSGIVADSDPRAELAETEAKARGMLLALGSRS